MGLLVARERFPARLADASQAGGELSTSFIKFSFIVCRYLLPDPVLKYNSRLRASLAVAKLPTVQIIHGIKAFVDVTFPELGCLRRFSD